MTIRKSIALSLIALATAAPGLVFANPVHHPADTEVGATHPDHIQRNISHGTVAAPVKVAQNNGVSATKATPPSKTREQVQQEYMNTSATEKQRQREMFGSGSN